MLLITKSQSNNLVLTLNERSDIFSSGGTPFYLFELLFEQDNGYTNKYFVTSGQSSNHRYNEFTVIESGGTESYSGNTISLNLPTGQFKYSVWEQDSNSNLNSSLASKFIETGRLFVKENTNNLNQYFY